MTQQFRTLRVAHHGLTLGGEEAQKGVGYPSRDEERDSRTLYLVSGRWQVGTEITYDDTDAVPLRVSVTNATWDSSARTLTKTDAFVDYEWQSGDVWIPLSVDGGWNIGDVHTIASKTDDSTIVLAAGGSYPASNSVSDGGAGRVVDLTNETVPYDKHRFVKGEAVSFTGAGRPASSTHGSGGNNLVLTTQQFYVEPVDEDTIKFHGSLELDDPVNFSGQGVGGAWNIVRYFPHYREEHGAGGTQFNELYNTIGAPVESTGYRHPADDVYWDAGFDVPPMALSQGGLLEGEVCGMLKQGSTTDRTLYFVLDPDPDVRGEGAPGELLFTATVVAATDIWTKTSHGLRNRDVVQTRDNGGNTAAATTSTNYWVRRIDADTFYLCSDPTLTTIINVGSDGEANIAKVGNRNRIRFAFTVPNSVSVVQTIDPITDATWTLGTLTLVSTGSFANYVSRTASLADGSTGDYYETTTTDGGWTNGKRYPVASRTNDDTIVLLDPDGDAPADNAISDGKLIQHDFVPFMLRWRFVKNLGELSLTSAVGCGMWLAELVIYPSNLISDPATSADGLVIHQAVHKTFPRQGVNFTETRRQDWGPVSKAWYYPTDAHPTFTFAADEEVTGGTSGAVGLVVSHDNARQTILYRPKAVGEDWQAGETLTGSSGSLTCGPVERGPLPTRVAMRMAVSGQQDGSFDVRVESARVTLHQPRPN
jgi:hypothetical protein